MSTDRAQRHPVSGTRADCVDTDQLTGLATPNSVRLQARAMQLQADADGQRLAFLFIDLDRFKAVNDTVGHAGGDAVLREIAAALASAMYGAGLLTRLAGNEFLAVACCIDSATQVSTLIERLREALDRVFVSRGHGFKFTASVGIALYPDDGDDVEDLISKAYAAKHLARRGGRNSVLFHTEGMNTDLEQRRAVERALADAIDRHEFFMRYQPQVDLRTGAIVGLEALVRWARPEVGEVPPGQFIPVAEESGLIIDLGPETIRLVCAQLQGWHDAGIAVPVSVNLSPVEIANGDADTRILEIIEAAGIPPELLAIEITESGLIDETSKTEVTIANLRESGVALSIDDFLTGYSNFAYIRRFQATHLKIDRSFVSGIDTSLDNQAILRAAMQMALALGLEIVAEGLETAAEARILVGLGCTVGQGYLFAEPLLAHEVDVLLRRGSLPIFDGTMTEGTT